MDWLNRDPRKQLVRPKEFLEIVSCWWALGIELMKIYVYVCVYQLICPIIKFFEFYMLNSKVLLWD